MDPITAWPTGVARHGCQTSSDKRSTRGPGSGRPVMSMMLVMRRVVEMGTILAIVVVAAVAAVMVTIMIMMEAPAWTVFNDDPPVTKPFIKTCYICVSGIIRNQKRGNRHIIPTPNTMPTIPLRPL